MANPSTFTAADFFAVLEVSSGASASTTISDPEYGLEVRHTGLDSAGALSTSVSVLLGVNTAPGTGYAGGVGRFILNYGDPPLFIKPGCSTLYTYGLGGATTLSINYVLTLQDRG